VVGTLLDAQSRQRRLRHHLAGELHARRHQAERGEPVADHAAHPAVEVAHVDAEEQPADEAQDRVAQVAMQEGHGAGRDAALEPVADHEVRPGAQAVQEGFDGGEVVAVVAVGEHHETALRRADAGRERRPVATPGDLHDAGAMRFGDGLRTVDGAVVGDQHLAFDLLPAQEFTGPEDALFEGARLVEAGHEDGEFHTGLAMRIQGSRSQGSAARRRTWRQSMAKSARSTSVTVPIRSGLTERWYLYITSPSWKT
jgi:hypothetical protein